MHIAIFINTPAQAHFVNNIAKGLSEKGHKITALSRDYGETLAVLNELGSDHITYSVPKRSKLSKIFRFPMDILTASQLLSRKGIDLIFGFGIIETYAGLLIRAPVVIFTDTEPMANKISYSIQYKLFLPFVNKVITPSSFRQDLGKKHIKIDSYKEVAYLHPNYYSPNDDIFNLLGIEKEDEYAILRFNAFDAVHDAGITGFSDHQKVQLVRELEKRMKVFISSEAELPSEINDRAMTIPKNRIHDALYYSQLLVTDTGTMATEAAILGVPTVRCQGFVGDNDMGNFIELENKYGLIFNFKDPKKAIEKAIELASSSGLKAEWSNKKERFIKDQIDISQFIIDFIEKNYGNIGCTVSI